MDAPKIDLFLKRRSVFQLIILTELCTFLMFWIYVLAIDRAPLSPNLDYVIGLAFIFLMLGSPFVWMIYGALRPKDPVRSVAAQASLGDGAVRVAQWLGGLLILGFLSMIGSGIAVWVWPDRKWANEWWYSWAGGSDLNKPTISVQSIPHDCEFLTAPMGSKHCHYKQNVVTVRIRSDAPGARSISMDDGKTWSKAEPSDHPAVFISWEKVEE